MIVERKYMEIIVFLDLLGFSKLVENDINQASIKLQRLKDFIKYKLIDDKVLEEHNYPEEKKYGYLYTCKDLINISDSIIVTRDSNKNGFFKDLGRFVSELFVWSATNVYNDLELNLNSKSVLETCLLRGGIACENDYGTNCFTTYNKNESKIISGVSIVGNGYITAYKLEAKGKGPVLIISTNDYNSLSKEEQCYFSDYLDGYKELLWPYFYMDPNKTVTLVGGIEDPNYLSAILAFKSDFLISALKIMNVYSRCSDSTIKGKYKTFGMTILKSLELYKKICITKNVTYKEECIKETDKMIEDLNVCLNNL